MNQCDSLTYIENLFTTEEDLTLKEIHAQFSDKKKFIQISSLEGKILYMLIKMNSIKNIVEIGTLAGYSTLWMAKAIPKTGKIYTIEKNTEHAQIAKRNFAKHEEGSKITLLEGEGLIQLNQLIKLAPFDMIFIDANKDGYCNYLNWAEQNIKTKGLVVADNTLLFNTVFLEKPTNNISLKSWAIMKKFNKRISDKTKYDSIMLPTTEGLTVTIKKS
ncbi:MAG: O-methyltransferase [Rickettsiaceae bacterium H1]|nr:O-methyltransferase [Rickettsiaceae bacterium H1]